MIGIDQEAGIHQMIRASHSVKLSLFSDGVVLCGVVRCGGGGVAVASVSC